MKKLLSVLLALVMLVSVISVPAFAEGETLSVVYHYTDAATGEATTLPVTEGVTAGEVFAIKFVAPNTSDKYFVGWYTDAQFTGEPVASITAADGVNNLYARYKEYPANVNVNFLASHGNKHYPSAYLPTLKTDSSLYAARAKMVTYSINGVTTNEDADGTYYEMKTNGPSPLWFADEDDMMYQLRPNANYKLTFQYKHNGQGDGTLSVSAALGKAKSAFSTIDTYDAAASWGSDRNAAKQYGGFTANNTTEWKTADITFNTSELNYADNYPVVGLYITNAGWGDGEGLQFKNIVLEELIPEELSVVYHYLDENGEWAEEPVTEGVTLNGSYRVDFIPENTASKYFTGWYDNEQYNGNPVASITTSIDGKNHLYARYKEFPTNANVGFLASHSGNHYPATYWPVKSSADSIYYAMAKMVNFTINGVQSATDEAGAHYFVESNGATMLVLADADNLAYQVKPNTSYKVTFDYKHGGNGGDNSMTVNAFIGQSKAVGAKDSWSDAITWGGSFVPAKESTAITVNDTENWNTHSFVVAGSDLEGYYPVIGLRFESFTNPERIFFKNIVIEEIANIAVNLYVDSEIDRTEEVAPGSTFLPDYIPEKEGCYFTGWFTNPECTNAVPAEGVVVNEETNLYAGFETCKTVKYYVGNEVVNTVGNLKVGDTHVVEYEPDAIEGMTFVGWYTEEAFENVATSIAITGDVNLYAKFVEPFGLTYVYKNKDGSEAKKVVEGVQVGDTYAIDFLAPNTNTQYFVGWYLDSNYSTAATKNVNLANDEAYKLYAKYVDYPTSIDLIIPGNGATNETVKMPIITTEGSVDKVVEYATNPIVASVFRGASTYDAATNTTTFNGSDSYPNYYISHILTDANKNFVAGKPGKTYKITFEATSSTGAVSVSFGVGAPADNFERAWGAYQWNRNKSYRNLLEKSSSVTLAKDVFNEYSIVYTVPADFPEDAYNFFGLYFDKPGVTGDTYAVRNISIEEYVAKAYLHVGEDVTEHEVTPGVPFMPEEDPAAPEGMIFKGWYLDENFATAMPETGAPVEGDVHLYAKFDYPLSVVYNYLAADGTETKDIITEGVAIDTAYEITLIPANTADKYFVGWYTDAEYTSTPVRSITPSVDGANNLYARYKEFPTNANAGFLASHSGNHYPATYWPVKSSADSKYYAMAKTVNFTINGVQSATDESGAYNFVESNGATMLVLSDADNMAYQVKPNTSYKVTFDYKHGGNGGDNSMTVNAFIGQSKTVGTKDSWSDAITWGPSCVPAKTATAITVNDTENWNTHSFVVAGSDLEGYYPVIGLRFESFTNPERIFFKNIVIEEYEIPNSAGEYSEQIGGVVYEAGEVEDGETYAVTFNYTGAAANFGFFTADKEEAGVYTNVGAVDGDKVIISVNGDGTYTAYVTVDKASGAGDTLYAYAKDVTTAGEVTDVTVTKLVDVITNDGAAVLNGDREQAAGAQAIRYFFAYNTTDGKDIIINGVSYAIKERGFLFANGKNKLDDGVWTGAQGLVKRAVSGDALANCWAATANGDDSFRIKYSTYVGGFAADDDRELFVKGYITFTANGTDYTIYAEASNGSVATIKAKLGQ